MTSKEPPPGPLPDDDPDSKGKGKGKGKKEKAAKPKKEKKEKVKTVKVKKEKKGKKSRGGVGSKLKSLLTSHSAPEKLQLDRVAYRKKRKGVVGKTESSKTLLEIANEPDSDTEKTAKPTLVVPPLAFYRPVTVEEKKDKMQSATEKAKQRLERIKQQREAEQLTKSETERLVQEEEGSGGLCKCSKCCQCTIL